MFIIPDSMILKVSRSVIQRELSDEEGFKNRVYKCTAGHSTVGIGHNIDACSLDNIIGRRFKTTPVLTNAEVELVFEYDLSNVLSTIQRNFPWFSELPENEQYVMISLVFNMGIGTLLKFKNTLRSWKIHDTDGVVRGLRDSAWHHQVGNRSSKLETILESGKI